MSSTTERSSDPLRPSDHVDGEESISQPRLGFVGWLRWGWRQLTSMRTALILLLVRSPHELIGLTQSAASNVGEILLQFPLYAGILGMMTTTGLVAVLSDAFVAISNPVTFGLLAFLAAGLVNFFVPSGGGQFAVQGPIMLQAGDALGVDPAITIMAVSYGDQWTNMIQPFWAIPLLAIAGLKMRDILGYTTVVLLASGLVFGGTLLLVSL